LGGLAIDRIEKDLFSSRDKLGDIEELPMASAASLNVLHIFYFAICASQEHLTFRKPSEGTNFLLIVEKTHQILLSHAAHYLLSGRPEI
jgi:hypothetical protein